jgi:hypothetical protein
VKRNLPGTSFGEPLLSGRGIVLDDSIVPQRTDLKVLCGWRFSRIDGTRGLADAIILGPNLTKTRLNIPTNLVEQWVKDVPRKTSLWTAKERQRLPPMLVVLEEWISPTWTYVASDENVDNPGSSAVGLVRTDEGPTPEWLHLAIPQETLTVTYRFGNTGVVLLSI